MMPARPHRGEQVAHRIEHAQAAMYSADETAEVGIDLGTPVVAAIGSEAKSRFTGQITKVTIEGKPMPAPAKAEAKEGNKNSGFEKKSAVRLRPFLERGAADSAKR